MFYYCGKTLENGIKKLQSDLKIVLKWFRKNKMIANPGKFQYMSLPSVFQIEGFQLESAKSVDLLGIIIDHNLTFDTHTSSICKTASAKVKSLSRIRNALMKNKRIFLYNSFILSQFNYCAIIWMFCSKTSSKKIEQRQKRGSRIV